MNELIEKGIGLFPAYFADLIAIITGPKQFVARRLSEGLLFDKAFIFLALSYGIAFALKTPMLQQNPWIDLGAGAVFTLLQSVGFATAIWLAWRSLGGRGTLASTLLITFYLAGVVEFILGFGYLAILGTIRAADPSLYEEILKAIRSGAALQLFTQNERLWQSLGFRLAMLAYGVSNLALVTWIIAGWGAYRSQHQLSKFRSALAFLLFGVFCIPVAALLFVMGNALVR